MKVVSTWGEFSIIHDDKPGHQYRYELRVNDEALDVRYQIEVPTETIPHWLDRIIERNCNQFRNCEPLITQNFKILTARKRTEESENAKKDVC